MQGMVRNSTNNYNNSNITQNSEQMANMKAQHKIMEEHMKNLTHKTEKPAEERKQLNKDGRNKQEFEQKRKNRQKREDEAASKNSDKNYNSAHNKKGDTSLFDISI